MTRWIVLMPLLLTAGWMPSFADCMTGPDPAGGIVPTCSGYDHDGDEDIDLFDFAEYQVQYEGSN